jgi:hypothetical protein
MSNYTYTDGNGETFMTFRNPKRMKLPIKVFDIVSDELKAVITTEAQRDKWRIDLEDAGEQLPEREEQPKDHVNPSHYQSYMTVGPEELQWLEAMQRLPTFRNPVAMLGALELQIRKYLDRLGQKDANTQELRKSVWYLVFMIAYIENFHKPVWIEGIPILKILSGNLYWPNGEPPNVEKDLG